MAAEYYKEKDGGDALNKILILPLLLLVLILLPSCDDSISKKEIFNLVIRNEELLLEDISKNNFDESLKIKGIQNVTPRDVYAFEIPEGEGYIDFYCGGSGIAPAGFYCGFYYSDNGEASGIWCTKTETLVRKGAGFEYNSSGDDSYYTERIVGNFFYYKAVF